MLLRIRVQIDVYISVITRQKNRQIKKREPTYIPILFCPEFELRSRRLREITQTHGLIIHDIMRISNSIIVL